MQLKDATDSINVVISDISGTLDKKMMKKIAKVKIQSVISEWSLICGKNWESNYLVIDYQDIVFKNDNIQEHLIEKEGYKINNKEQQFQVLYASQPTFLCNKQYPSVYAAVRKMKRNYYGSKGPQADYDNDPANNPVKFIELCLYKKPAALFLGPGTILGTKIQNTDEKYVALLQTHLKKMLKLNPECNEKR